MNHNLYLDRCVKTNLFSKEGGFALDLGCGDGRDSKFLTEKGYTVISVDQKSDYPGVVLSDIRDFIIEPGKYSFVMCSNVLPFLASQVEVQTIIKKSIEGLKRGGLFYFTVFGKNSDIKVPVYFTYQEIEDFVGLLDIEVHEKFSREGPATSLVGHSIHSHVHTFLLRKI